MCVEAPHPQSHEQYYDFVLEELEALEQETATDTQAKHELLEF